MNPNVIPPCHRMEQGRRNLARKVPDAVHTAQSGKGKSVKGGWLQHHYGTNACSSPPHPHTSGDALFFAKKQNYTWQLSKNMI